MSEGLLVERDGGVLQLTLDRPAQLNAMTPEMLEAAAAAVEQAGDDVRVVVLAGSGRAFCSGADLATDKASGDDPDAHTDPTLAGINRLVTAIVATPRPVVARVHGPAAGAGCSLALAADVTIASESAYFLLAFVNIGLMPDGGATELVAASIGRARANRMALLGERLSGTDAATIGLVHSCVPDDALDDAVDAVVSRFVTGPTQAYARAKAALNANTLGGLEATLRREAEGQHGLLRADDFAEGVAAFREKRPARFTGR